MKSAYFIPTLALLINTMSCSPKNNQEQDPQPTEVQKITSIGNADDNSYPIEVTQQDYNSQTPPMDSDFWTIDTVTKLSYSR